MRGYGSALMGLAVAGLCMGQASAASEYLQRLGPGDDAYELAREMEKRGCTMTEKEVTDFLGDRGARISDVQAVILDLSGAGDIVWDRKDSYTLVGWNTCA